jgi:predicted transcriptional regulator
MLEQLFGSKTRVRLLRLFLANQDKSYFVRQLTRKIDAQINAVRNELDNLVQMGLVMEVFDTKDDEDGARSSQQRRYYRINTDALLYSELRALFFKSGVLLEKEFTQRLSKAGKVSYLALMGHFVGDHDAPTDVFVVGNLDNDKVAKAVRGLESSLGKEVNYTTMASGEFRQRMDLTDRFLYSILDSQKIVVVDYMTSREQATQTAKKK